LLGLLDLQGLVEIDLSQNLFDGEIPWSHIQMLPKLGEKQLRWIIISFRALLQMKWLSPL